MLVVRKVDADIKVINEEIPIVKSPIEICPLIAFIPSNMYEAT